jgi:hypothetical protein
LIEPKISDPNKPYTIEELSTHLDRLYNSINKNEDKEETKKSPEQEKLEKAYKTTMKRYFKGGCRKCGVFGHKAADCRKPTGNGNQFKGGNGGGGPRKFN